MNNKKNTYQSLDELKANEIENINYKICYRDGLSDSAIIAIHGGKIEPGTSEIANEIAGKKHSFFSFEGIKDGGNFDLHIDSRVFNDSECEKIVKRSLKVVSIHGCNKSDQKQDAIFLGGLDVDLIEKIRKNLMSAGFAVEKTPFDLLGESDKNICNKGKSNQGVQIEIQRGSRNKMFDGDLKNREKPNLYFDKFVSAIKEALED